MKVLNEEIKFCGYCPYCQFDEYDLSYDCKKNRNIIDKELHYLDYTDIMKKVPPEWCPLPTKQV